jgi:transposase
MQYFLGIDVSKAKLDVALLLVNGKFKSKVFTNDVVGFAALVPWLLGHVPDAHAWKPQAATTRRWLAS